MILKRSLVGGAMSAMLLTATMASSPAPAQALTNCTVSAADQAYDAEELQFLRLLNQHRVANGRSVVNLNTELTRSAAWLSRDLATKNYFSHIDSLGRSVSTRARDCGVRTTFVIENVAAGNATAQATFDQWRTDAPHNAIMLSSGMGVVGIARAYDANATYGWYWTLDLTPADSFQNVYFPAHWGPNPHLSVPPQTYFYRSIGLLDNTGDPALSQQIQTFVQIVNYLRTNYNPNYPVVLYYKDLFVAPGDPCRQGPPQYVVVCRDESLGGTGSATAPGAASIARGTNNHILYGSVRFRPSVVNPMCPGAKFTLAARLISNTLGLDHNLTNPASAMFPTIPAGRCTFNGWTEADLDRMNLMYNHRVN